MYHSKHEVYKSTKIIKLSKDDLIHSVLIYLPKFKIK